MTKKSEQKHVEDVKRTITCTTEDAHGEFDRADRADEDGVLDEWWELQTNFWFAGYKLAEVTDEVDGERCIFRLYRSMSGDFVCHAQGRIGSWLAPDRLIGVSRTTRMSMGVVCATVPGVAAFFGDNPLAKRLLTEAKLTQSL